MKPSELVRKMMEAGATLEACVIALEALEERDAVDAERRAKAAERKRKSREKQAECDQERDGHVTVTGQSQDTPPPPPEDKKGPDLKKTHTPSTSPKKNPPTGVKKKGFRLPEGWKPSEADMAWARREYPGYDHQHETEKFTDHWRSASGANAAKRDWSAAWKNWIRKAGDSGWMRRHRRDDTPPHLRGVIV